MIRRPPRSTLFPYTNALPIYVCVFAPAQRNRRPIGPSHVLGALCQQLQGGIEIALSHFGQRLPAILSRKTSLGFERGRGILAGNQVMIHGAWGNSSLARRVNGVKRSAVSS